MKVVKLLERLVEIRYGLVIGGRWSVLIAHGQRLGDADEEAREEAESDGLMLGVLIALPPRAERLNRDGLRQQAERSTRMARVEMLLLLSSELQRLAVDQIDQIGHTRPSKA